MNMCSLIILAAKNIKYYSFGLLFVGVVHFTVVQLDSPLR